MMLIFSLKRCPRKANILTREKKTIGDKFNSQPQTVKKADIAIMNQDNAHFLTGDEVGQVAVDFKAPDTNTRGTNRATFDYHAADDGSTQSQFSGYTDKHAGYLRSGFEYFPSRFAIRPISTQLGLVPSKTR